MVVDLIFSIYTHWRLWAGVTITFLVCLIILVIYNTLHYNFIAITCLPIGAIGIIATVRWHDRATIVASNAPTPGRSNRWKGALIGATLGAAVPLILVGADLPSPAALSFITFTAASGAMLGAWGLRS